MQAKWSYRTIAVGRVLGLLSLLAWAGGCATQTERLPAESALKVKKLMIVAVEAPPLEVIPDLIEARQPIIRSLGAMTLPSYTEGSLYKYPGDIVIFGQTTPDDGVRKITAGDPELRDGGKMISVVSQTDGTWVPTEPLANYTARALSRGPVSAAYQGHYRRLPVDAWQRQRNLLSWRNGVDRWYEEDVSAVDYASLASPDTDGVIEIGVSHYRIFENQVSLQLLVKFIDPRSGRVLARTGHTAYDVCSSAQSLLAPDGSEFKKLIGRLGVELVDKNLQDIGLSSPSYRLRLSSAGRYAREG